MSRIIANNIRHNDATADSLSLDSSGNVSAPGNLSVTGTSTLTDDLNVDSGTLFVDASTNAVGVGTTSPGTKFEINSGHIRLSTNYRIGIGGTGDTPNDSFVKFASNELQFFTNNSERARITSDGTLRLNNSPGIDFSQIQTNATGMTSETLDSYEEGTWTPAMQIGGSSTGITGSFSGAYTKIGRTVSVVGLINLTNKGSNSGNVTIDGLPFSKNSSFRFYGLVGYFNWATVPERIRIDSGTTMDILTGHELARATNTALNNNTEIYFSFTYQTA